MLFLMVFSSCRAISVFVVVFSKRGKFRIDIVYKTYKTRFMILEKKKFKKKAYLNVSFFIIC